jgi:hypothetical protein
VAISFLTRERYDDFRRKWHLSSDTTRLAVVSDSAICQRVARTVYAGRQASMRRPPAPLAVVDLQQVYLTQEVGCEQRTVEVDHQFRWVGIWPSPNANC